jgi:hypothetical protein
MRFQGTMLLCIVILVRLQAMEKNVIKLGSTSKEISVIEEQLKPIKITAEMEQAAHNWISQYHGAEYNYLPVDIQKKIISFLPEDIYKLFEATLKAKLKDSGLKNDELKKIINQYIIEYIINSISLSFINPGLKKSLMYDYEHDEVDHQDPAYLDAFTAEHYADLKIKEIKNRSKNLYFDIKEFIDRVDALKVCSAKDRKEQYQEMEKIYGIQSKRIQGMTAKGWIECNAGLLQWD